MLIAVVLVQIRCIQGLLQTSKVVLATLRFIIVHRVVYAKIIIDLLVAVIITAMSVGLHLRAAATKIIASAEVAAIVLAVAILVQHPAAVQVAVTRTIAARPAEPEEGSVTRNF